MDAKFMQGLVWIPSFMKATWPLRLIPVASGIRMLLRMLRGKLISLGCGGPMNLSFATDPYKQVPRPILGYTTGEGRRHMRQSCYWRGLNATKYSMCTVEFALIEAMEFGGGGKE